MTLNNFLVLGAVVFCIGLFGALFPERINVDHVSGFCDVRVLNPSPLINSRPGCGRVVLVKNSICGSIALIAALKSLRLSRQRSWVVAHTQSLKLS